MDCTYILTQKLLATIFETHNSTVPTFYGTTEDPGTIPYWLVAEVKDMKPRSNRNGNAKAGEHRQEASSTNIEEEKPMASRAGGPPP